MYPIRPEPPRTPGPPARGGARWGGGTKPGEAYRPALLWLLSERPGGLTLAEAMCAGEPAFAATFLVGPEGGWTDPEHDDALRLGFVPVSLGAPLLRAETAALAALSLWMLSSPPASGGPS